MSIETEVQEWYNQTVARLGKQFGYSILNRRTDIDWFNAYRSFMLREHTLTVIRSV